MNPELKLSKTLTYESGIEIPYLSYEEKHKAKNAIGEFINQFNSFLNNASIKQFAFDFFAYRKLIDACNLVTTKYNQYNEDQTDYNKLLAYTELLKASMFINDLLVHKGKYNKNLEAYIKKLNRKYIKEKVDLYAKVGDSILDEIVSSIQSFFDNFKSNLSSFYDEFFKIMSEEDLLRLIFGKNYDKFININIHSVKADEILKKLFDNKLTDDIYKTASLNLFEAYNGYFDNIYNNVLNLKVYFYDKEHELVKFFAFGKCPLRVFGYNEAIVRSGIFNSLRSKFDIVPDIICEIKRDTFQDEYLPLIAYETSGELGLNSIFKSYYKKKRNSDALKNLESKSERLKRKLQLIKFYIKKLEDKNLKISKDDFEYVCNLFDFYRKEPYKEYLNELKEFIFKDDYSLNSKKLGRLNHYYLIESINKVAKFIKSFVKSYNALKNLYEKGNIKAVEGQFSRISNLFAKSNIESEIRVIESNKEQVAFAKIVLGDIEVVNKAFNSLKIDLASKRGSISFKEISDVEKYDEYEKVSAAGLKVLKILKFLVNISSNNFNFSFVLKNSIYDEFIKEISSIIKKVPSRDSLLNPEDKIKIGVAIDNLIQKLDIDIRYSDLIQVLKDPSLSLVRKVKAVFNEARSKSYSDFLEAWGVPDVVEICFMSCLDSQIDIWRNIINGFNIFEIFNLPTFHGISVGFSFHHYDFLRQPPYFQSQKRLDITLAKIVFDELKRGCSINKGFFGDILSNLSKSYREMQKYLLLKHGYLYFMFPRNYKDYGLIFDYESSDAIIDFEEFKNIFKRPKRKDASFYLRLLLERGVLDIDYKGFLKKILSDNKGSLYRFLPIFDINLKNAKNPILEYYFNKVGEDLNIESFLKSFNLDDKALINLKEKIVYELNKSKNLEKIEEFESASDNQLVVLIKDYLGKLSLDKLKSYLKRLYLSVSNLNQYMMHELSTLEKEPLDFIKEILGLKSIDSKEIVKRIAQRGVRVKYYEMFKRLFAYDNVLQSLYNSLKEAKLSYSQGLNYSEFSKDFFILKFNISKKVKRLLEAGATITSYRLLMRNKTPSVQILLSTKNVDPEKFLSPKNKGLKKRPKVNIVLPRGVKFKSPFNVKSLESQLKQGELNFEIKRPKIIRCSNNFKPINKVLNMPSRMPLIHCYIEKLKIKEVDTGLDLDFKFSGPIFRNIVVNFELIRERGSYYKIRYVGWEQHPFNKDNDIAKDKRLRVEFLIRLSDDLKGEIRSKYLDLYGNLQDYFEELKEIKDPNDESEIIKLQEKINEIEGELRRLRHYFNISLVGDTKSVWENLINNSRVDFKLFVNDGDYDQIKFRIYEALPEEFNIQVYKERKRNNYFVWSEVSIDTNGKINRSRFVHTLDYWLLAKIENLSYLTTSYQLIRPTIKQLGDYEETIKYQNKNGSLGKVIGIDANRISKWMYTSIDKRLDTLIRIAGRNKVKKFYRLLKKSARIQKKASKSAVPERRLERYAEELKHFHDRRRNLREALISDSVSLISRYCSDQSISEIKFEGLFKKGGSSKVGGKLAEHIKYWGLLSYRIDNLKNQYYDYSKGNSLTITLVDAYGTSTICPHCGERLVRRGDFCYCKTPSCLYYYKDEKNKKMYINHVLAAINISKGSSSKSWGKSKRKPSRSGGILLDVITIILAPVAAFAGFRLAMAIDDYLTRNKKDG